jgi:prevent-host-death family protein
MIRDHNHGHMTTTRTIPAGEFKAKCLALLDEVAATGEEIIVTKRGKPVARLVAPEPRYPNLLGTVSYDREEDLIEPTGETWEAEQ